MSTSYYRLRKPLTHIRVEDGGSHQRITLWINHGNAGTLTVRTEELNEVTSWLYQYEEDNKCPLRTHWGGKERGTVVTVHDPSLADEAVVISDYGQVLTVGEVKSRHGRYRSDGLPTELFGYEQPPCP